MYIYIYTICITKFILFFLCYDWVILPTHSIPSKRPTTTDNTYTL